MSETIIQVENLSKRYRIGAKEEGYNTFCEAVIDVIIAPIRNFRCLKKLNSFDDSEGQAQSEKPNIGAADLTGACHLSGRGEL